MPPDIEADKALNMGCNGMFGDILVVEDDEGLNLVIRKNLEREGFRTRFAIRGKDAVETIKNNDCHLVLLDYKLPDMNANELLNIVRLETSAPPFIIMTGFGDQKIAVEMMKQGAVDYLVKDGSFIDMLPVAVRRAINTIASDKKASESEARFTRLVTELNDVVWFASPDGSIFHDINHSFEKVYGVACGELESNPSLWIEMAHPEDREIARASAGELIETGKATAEYRIVRPDGGVRWLLDRKSLIRDEKGRVIQICGVASDITERKQAEIELAESEKKYRTLFENNSDGVLIADNLTKKFVIANKKICEMLGYSETELCALGVENIHPLNELPYVLRKFEELAAGTSTSAENLPCLRKDGTKFFSEISVGTFEMGGRSYSMGMFRDITERKRVEEERHRLQMQLNQAHKMEAVGRLAGGVAHDFNNMLSVIIGTAQLALIHADPATQVCKDLQDILNAGERSANLTRQLLAFSRRQAISPEILNLNEALAGMIKMLQRIIGEDIELSWSPGYALWEVKIDPAQIDQILANLVVNARDAISGAGRVSIETENTSLDEEYCMRHADTVPGDYVLLSVRDNGCGMDRETMCHIFEPFFTTKVTGKGTGLGLATVFGIVKQNHGCIDVYSEPGQGTTFKVYLARFADETADEKKPEDKKALPGGAETVLIVEDEPAILSLGVRILDGLGYKVLSAIRPGEAVRLFEERSDEIDLLLTDTVMPDMNGRELADKLKSIKPSLKCLFMSGYTADVIAHRGVLDQEMNFIQKPFSIEALARKTRVALDR